MTEVRAVLVLRGRFEYLPIVSRALTQWLKGHGGNGAVTFPKPASTSAS